jgi:PAS domain S-box-containing protein
MLAAGYLGVILGGAANGGALRSTVGLGACDVLEVTASVAIIVHFIKPNTDLSRLRDVMVCGAAALVSAMLSAVGAGLVLGWLGRPDLGRDMIIWTLANGLGQMIGAPVILTLTEPGRLSLSTFKPFHRSALSFGLLAVVVVGVFTQTRSGLPFLVFAPLLLVVFQLGPLGAALGVLITAILAVVLTVGGLGPLMVIAHTPVDRILVLQVFLLACVVVNFPVAAVLADRRRALEVLAISETRLRLLSAHSRDVVIRVGLDRRIIDASPSCRHYGYEPDDLIGRSGAELNHPDDRAAVSAMFDDLLRDPGRRSGAVRQWRVRTQSGDWLWMEGALTAVLDERGEVKEGAIVMRDISEHKASAEALAESEARYRLLAENSRDLVLQFDLKGTILYASAAARLFGYRPEDLVGRPCFNFIHPDDLGRARERMLARAYPALGIVTDPVREMRVLAADGAYRWVEGNPSVSRDDQGRPVSFTDSLRDVGARREALAALAESEANYRLLADSAPDVIVRVRVGGVITYLSRSVEQVTGYTAPELIGTNLYELVHPEDRASASAQIQAYLALARTGARAVLEYRLVRKDGAIIWVEANPYQLIDEHTGETLGLGGFLRDVTARRMMEDDLRRQRAEAEASEAARAAAEEAARESMSELTRVARLLSVGEFATSIAHELNQPLAAIVTNSDTSLRWLAKTPPNLDEARAAIGRTLRDAGRAAAVISRTRAMLSKRPPALSRLDINDCVEEVLAFTDTELRRNGVTVRRRFQRPSPVTNGDRVQLQQVLLNLVRNGMEAMTDTADRPRVLSVRTLTQNDGDVLVEVEDSGVGLTPDAADHLFDSFYTTKIGGIGLGLPISRSIVETHGGRLWAAPAPEGGAIFRFTLQGAEAPR